MSRASRPAALAALVVLLGCEPPQTTVAAPPTPSLAATPGHPSSWPQLIVEPAAPCPGDDVVVTGTGLPPGEPFTLWLGPYIPPGPAQPAWPGGVDGFRPLGGGVADAEGRIESRLISPEAARQVDSLWLTYDRAIQVVPNAAALLCGASAAVTGRVVDARGQAAPAGTRLELVAIQGYHRVLAVREVPVVDGRYTLPAMPLDAALRFTVKVPNWPVRQRWAGYLQPTGGPLTFNFGGPAEAADPHAPAFYVGADIYDDTMATTTVRGRVFDPQGRPVPDAWGVVVAIAAVRAPVRGGTYEAAGVPTGTLHHIALRQAPDQPVSAFVSVQRAFPPDAVVGRPNVLDFGGPDPEAAGRPYPGPFGPPPTPEPPGPMPPPPSPWTLTP